MLATQRYQYILERLQKEKSVSVTELVKALHSSQATIRRDLSVLEQENKLTRVHGGAVLLSYNDESTPWDRLEKHVEEKQAVAQFVAKRFLTNQHRMIYLDAGSSTHMLIPYLNEQYHTVVTNGVHHVPKLLEHNISTIVIGGQIKQQTQAIVGVLAWQQIRQYHFDVAFMGTNAIDITMGFSTPDTQEALLKKAAIQQAGQSIVLADSSKFDKKAFHQFATFDDVSLVVNHCLEPYLVHPKIYTVGDDK